MEPKRNVRTSADRQNMGDQHRCPGESGPAGLATLKRAVAALTVDAASGDKVAVQLAPGTGVAPVSDAAADGMIEVRASDDELYTVFASDLADASVSPQGDEDTPRAGE
jgi:hypothetical protein